MARKAQSKPEQVVETTETTQAAAIKTASLESVIEETQPISACGGALRAARERQKLSLQDIASQLRLGVNQVEALEADRYDKLPQPSIVRGFIRNYAKALKLDAAPIVAAYSAMVPNSAPQSFAVKPPEHRSVIGEHRANFSFISFIGLLLCFAIIAGLFYYYTQVIKPNVASNQVTPVTQTTLDTATTTPTTDSAEFALPAAERQDNVTPIDLPAAATDTATGSQPNATLTPESVTTAAPVNSATTASPSDAANALQPKPNVATPAVTLPAATVPTVAVPSATPSSKTLPSAAPISATPSNETPLVKETIQNNAKSAQLVIDASEETWVNIVDANDRQFYSKVLAAGTTETVTAAPPLTITVGNAHGTSISMNGQALDLLAHTRDRVARLKVN